MSSNSIKRTFLDRLFDWTNVVLMLLFCATILYPVWDMIVVSLSRPEDINYLSVNLWPKNVEFQAYQYCVSNPRFFTAFRTSILRALLGTAYHIVITCSAAFILMKKDMPFRRLITLILLIPMFFSGGLVPQYILYQNLGLINSLLVYILPNALSFFTVIIVRNFFLSIDRELEEAATLDGAGIIQVLFRIYLPLSKPVMATITLWHLIYQWNAWFDNMVFVPDEKLLTLQFMLRKIIMQAEMFQKDAAAYAQYMMTKIRIDSGTIRAATTVLIIIPIILVYPFLQRYFVKGIMIGSVKG